MISKLVDRADGGTGLVVKLEGLMGREEVSKGNKDDLVQD